MAMHIHRWLLFAFAVCFVAAGCLNFAALLRGEQAASLLAGLFYSGVGVICMGAHGRSVASDSDDEESLSQP